MEQFLSFYFLKQSYLSSSLAILFYPCVLFDSFSSLTILFFMMPFGSYIVLTFPFVFLIIKKILILYILSNYFYYFMLLRSKCAVSYAFWILFMEDYIPGYFTSLNYKSYILGVTVSAHELTMLMFSSHFIPSTQRNLLLVNFSYVFRRHVFILSWISVCWRWVGLQAGIMPSYTWMKKVLNLLLVETLPKYIKLGRIKSQVFNFGPQTNAL